MTLLIGLLAILALGFLCFQNWRRSIYLLFIIVIIEGAIRKWIFPQFSELIYFLKDFILVGIYINYYILSNSDKKYPIKNWGINSLTFITVAWCVFQAFNPSLGSPLVGIFGLRGYIFYIPLMWMIPSMFSSEKKLYNFLRLHTFFMIPVGILGFLQFFSPASSILNAYANDEAISRATFGNTGAARITGTFSFLSGYSVYLIVCFGLLITFLSLKQSRLWLWIFVSELFLVCVNSFMTGYRVVIFAAVLFLFLYFSAKLVTQPTNTLRLAKKFLFPSLVVAIAAFIWFRPAIDSFWFRVTSTDDVSARISGSLTQPFNFIQYKELDGFGTGATHQATPALRKVLKLPAGEPIPVSFEPEPGKIALELGPIGFFLWYGLRIVLAIALWNGFLKLRRPFLRQLALTACLIQIIHISNPLVFHHTFSIYFWFFSSFIWLLPKLEKIENRQEEQGFLQQYNDYTYLNESPY
ncbi:hypothetical protein [Synechocystis sp. PCC 7509]|uniref:hypothetical protein n=1 Tax=Synechocystis sp. PCC 7509 TaxID=927677 RepID=UPI0002AC21E6|nr:hypothetical protein [Synechocystis sp. PCC 7509]